MIEVFSVLGVFGLGLIFGLALGGLTGLMSQRRNLARRQRVAEMDQTATELESRRERAGSIRQHEVRPTAGRPARISNLFQFRSRKRP